MQLELSSDFFVNLFSHFVEEIKTENLKEYARNKRQKKDECAIFDWDFTDLQYEFEDRVAAALEKAIRAENLDFEKAASEINNHSSKLFEGESCS
ncbi:MULTISPECIES: hypothetical protein [unclassified Microcoleus]|uniref:hypothetical protein n=1 Tax=unclassified Microcoleus TaxID=2642155 RepID=UPI002FD601F9